MPTNPIVLMISPRAANYELLHRAITETGFKCEMRRADDVLIALARIAGGGIKLLILDVSVSQGDAKLESMRKLLKAVPQLPMAVWTNCADSSLPAIASQIGAIGCVTNGMDTLELSRILSAALAPHGEARSSLRENFPQANATIISVMGVKGGVGTTTVAMNIAAALTERGRVILAEVKPMFGSLQTHFHPGRMIRGFTNQEGAMDVRQRSIKSLLWPVPKVAGLRILFGPQTSEDCGEIKSGQANLVLQELASEADFVVLDLSTSFSPANQAFLGASNYLNLVMEPTSACLGLAKMTLNGIQGLEKSPASIGAIVVRHTSDGIPIPLKEIQSELDIPVLKVVPPASEFCLQGEVNRIPLIQCDPESIVAESFQTLSLCFLSARQSSPNQRVA